MELGTMNVKLTLVADSLLSSLLEGQGRTNEITC